MTQAFRIAAPGSLLKMALVAGLALGGAALMAHGLSAQGATKAAPKAAGKAATSTAAAGEMSYAPMLDKVMPGVVSIKVKGSVETEQLALFSNPVVSQLLGTEIKQPGPKGFTSSGSGVIIDAATGLVITNYHVVENATDIKVRLNDGREFEGTLIGQDPAVDIAAVRIKAHRLVSVPLGDSSIVRIGDLVFAIGNPLGLDSTATFGMVSSLRRTAVGYRNYEVYIQHDASVNSGNSGGALINLNGELIGINTAIISPSGGSVGLGFAIPIGYAKRIWDQLLKHGKVHRGHIGVKTTDMRKELFDTYGLATTQGAFVLRTQSGSPGQMAGLEFADVIVGMGGFNPVTGQWSTTPVQRVGQFEALMAGAEIGEEIRLEVLRGFERRVLPMRVGNMKPEPDLFEVPASIVRLAGVVLQPLSSDNPSFGKVRGVEVVEVKKGSLAEIVGLQAGDVMTFIDRDRIRTPEDVAELTKDKTQKFDVSIVRNGKPLKIQYPL